MTDFDHEACEFFDSRCRERGVLPRRIRESRTPNVRRPDFAIHLGGKTVIVEVKAIEPNEQDQDTRVRVRDVFSDIRRISKKLKKANGQLQPYAKRGIPGIVNIMDCTGQGLFFVPFDIHNAMFGRDAIELSVARDWRDYIDSPPFPRIERLKSAGRETLTPRHNSSISALLIFRRKSYSNAFVSLLFHNHFARNPIPSECTSHLVDYQYKSCERKGDLGGLWIQI